MISYQPFWNTMKKRGISTYALENVYGLNKSEIHRLKHDHNFNIAFLDYLCILFDCRIQDIVVCNDRAISPKDEHAAYC